MDCIATPPHQPCNAFFASCAVSPCGAGFFCIALQPCNAFRALSGVPEPRVNPLPNSFILSQRVLPDWQEAQDHGEARIDLSYY
jgi:hypothetical protein